MKVWAKTRVVNGQKFYHNHNISQAVHGFREMGFEIIDYESIDDIYDWVTKDDIVLDYIKQCQEIFKKFTDNHRCVEDYPDVLKKYMGRPVWTDTINNINCNPDKWGVFVKPVEEKAFTGRVINGTADLVGCGNHAIDYEVLCSPILDIKREWRGFVYYDNMIDIRPYIGDWHYYMNPSIVDAVMRDFITWEERPMACSLDFAVIVENGYEKTIFLEANDCYALGCYGLDPLKYAKMISARWSQILNRPDECQFVIK